MRSASELRGLLKKVDRKGYGQYKELRGCYSFQGYRFSIDHVQADPYAPPSQVSVHISQEDAKLPSEMWNTSLHRIALEDYLLRGFESAIRMENAKRERHCIHISEPKQEVIKRSAVVIDPKSGSLSAFLRVDFPAHGRTICARDLEVIIFQILDKCVKQRLFYDSLDKKDVQDAINLADDQAFIRSKLDEMGLVAFIANGSILPRASGVSLLPMRNAVPFKSPESLAVTLSLPHRGDVTGMGLRKGITVIVGGGYHGKSTLLEALEAGVYNHVKGDGREFVITNNTAVKIRSEDHRAISRVDISMFIQNLPNKKDTKNFSTEDASGSTSQAANMVEAIEAQSSVFLIDEDTCATNFMVKDELMQMVVAREREPIIPFVDRVQEIYTEYGISTILVSGSSGAFFHKAHCIIHMNEYTPNEITEFAKKQAAKFQAPLQIPPAPHLAFARKVKPDRQMQGHIRIRTAGLDTISLQEDTIDVRYVEQLVEQQQLNTLGAMLKYSEKRLFDGNRTMQEVIDQLVTIVEEKGLAAVDEDHRYDQLSMPRKQEIFACFNRFRKLHL